MGKYDVEVENTIFSFQNKSTNDINYTNKEIQTSYKIVNQYYMCTVTKNDVLRLIDELEKAYIDNTFHNKVSKLRQKYIGESTIEKSEVVFHIKNIGDYSLTLMTELTKKERNELLKMAYQVYQLKNSSYNDVWYKRGTSGVCVDINRKIVRIDSILAKNQISDGETLFDTALDTLVFSAFMYVSATYIDRDK